VIGWLTSKQRNLEEVYLMRITTPEQMRADMKAEIADWESKMADVEASQDSVWSVEYRYNWLQQMRHSIANRKTELENFNKLIAAIDPSA
jgi:hypothetical protein